MKTAIQLLGIIVIGLVFLGLSSPLPTNFVIFIILESSWVVLSTKYLK